MYIEYNSNPENKLVGDCVVRAISKVTDQDWERTYMEVCVQGFMMHDMPSSNSVWGGYLFTKGFRRYIIPDTYPKRYTVKQFCIDYPKGLYLLATDQHVIAVEDGNYYDTWDSGNDFPLYYWRKEISK